MKKNFYLLCVTVLSPYLSANRFTEQKPLQSTEIIKFNDFRNSIACQHEYYITSVGCDGFGSKELIGAGTGDCESAAENSVVRHNTNIDVCDTEARDRFLLNFATTVTILIKSIW